MTVCIAAACDNDERIVAVTDALLSMGDVTGESMPGKILWLGDWQFMYAGTPASFGLVSEEIESVCVDDPQALSRRRVQKTVRQAYRSVYSRLASSYVLNPFDMTMEEFKIKGLEYFGADSHGDMVRRIDQQGSQDEQLLVTGWGHAPRSVMIYEVGPSGDGLHTAAGFAAIGSGSRMAHTMLLLLGQARHRTLAETIFNVACAKFSSEKSSGLDVGKMTIMYVSRKRAAGDDLDKPCGNFLPFKDLDKLRSIWESYLKPRIPDEARGEITDIAAGINQRKVSPRDMVECIKAAQRIQEKYAPANPEDSPSPQSPTFDLSRQRPLRESPGGSDES